MATSSAREPLSRVDPVCGMSVDPERPAGGEWSYQGRDYGFCSAQCRERFRADPASFLTPKADAPPLRSAPGTKWTCPMHPEVIADEPGPCPKCGMALEPL
ncbi:MAG TPA: heavy metal-binding domain-containing protein, partial [Myxococcales bacterium]|nr:heavy metal-binding domain-containing protein [Myxococcales bacterium]